ncbi:MAG: ABC transporter ATP-binding protein, partial [Acidobacteria bacterium]|nr:ABC transporter ATP-binding protein [Acidobacteriota bacterium]
DLDLETLDLLEEAIAGFDGTVLLVSHDRVFLDNVVTSTLAVEAGAKPIEYVGGWEDYLRQTALRGSQFAVRSDTDSKEPPLDGQIGLPEPRPTSREPRYANRKLSFNEQRELATLPSRIQVLEAEQKSLQGEIESPEFYKAGADRIQTALARCEAVAREHDQLLARWMELEERA